MNIEIASREDVEHLLFAIESRLRAMGKTYQSSWAEDCEISALRRVASQCGVEFECDGGNTGFVVRRLQSIVTKAQ